MRIRIGIHYDVQRGEDLEAEAELAALLEHARAAEEAGAEIVWVAERPTQPGALIAAALPVCGALAARTQRVRIGTAVLPLPLHHPLRVAEDAATLDLLSGGRFELGLGLGADAQAAGGFGVARGERTARLEEAVALIRAAWREEPLAFGGDHHGVSGITVHPRPAQPGGPPLWLGAGAPDAQRRAARLGTGLWLPPQASPRPFLEAWSNAGFAAADARVATTCARSAPDHAAADAEDALRRCDGAGALDLVVAVSALGCDAGAALLAVRHLVQRFGPGRQPPR
jgi:alkanesulfonate monooxygenase SsuD/methylene tetrahydromethanopterin reductase-like flavin-dependent oxidoreductase (luciferase family)